MPNNKSDKQKKGLYRAFEAANIKGTMPPKVTSTRWLPHFTRGLKSLCRNYPAYILHLSDASHTNPKAEGLVKLLLSRHIMALVLLLKVRISHLFITTIIFKYFAFVTSVLIA